MPQMWVTFAHVVSLKLRSCSTVKSSCFQMWLLDIPWGVLYKSSFPGPNVQRFRGVTRGPGSCIESQPIKICIYIYIYIYIFFFFFFQSFVGVLIAHLGTAGMRVRNVWAPAVHLHVGGTKECLSFLCRVYTTASVHTVLFTRRISFSFPAALAVGLGAAWGQMMKSCLWCARPECEVRHPASRLGGTT